MTDKIALNQFNDFLTQQGNLTCHLSGNHKYMYHSTETLSLLVTGHIFKAIAKKEITAMVLIDLHVSKAFDSMSSCKGCVRQVKRRSGLRATFNTKRMLSTHLTLRR